MLNPTDMKSFEQEVLDSTRPVIVCFAADWSTTSAKVQGMLESLDEAAGDGVLVARVDVSKIPEAAASYNVSMLPTTILFVEGVALDILHGLEPFDKLKTLIDQATAGDEG